MFVNIVLLTVGLMMLTGNIFSLRYILAPPVRFIDVVTLFANIAVCVLYYIAVGAVLLGVN